MRYAILSDIHGNLPACQAVLSDLSHRDVHSVLCLGDMIGYGPYPEEVMVLLREVKANMILGNHDAAAVGKLDPNIFREEAHWIIEWTVQQMSDLSLAQLQTLPYVLEADGFTCVHCDMVHPEDFDYLEDEAAARATWAACDAPLLFVGHTHFPVVHELAVNGQYGMYYPHAFRVNPEVRYIVNVGSVGMSRDDDYRACYLIYDDEERTICWYRIPYDVHDVHAAAEAVHGPYNQVDYLISQYSRQGESAHQIQAMEQIEETVTSLPATAKLRVVEKPAHSPAWRKKRHSYAPMIFSILLGLGLATVAALWLLFHRSDPGGSREGVSWSQGFEGNLSGFSPQADCSMRRVTGGMSHYGNGALSIDDGRRPTFFQGLLLQQSFDRIIGNEFAQGEGLHGRASTHGTVKQEAGVMGQAASIRDRSWIDFGKVAGFGRDEPFSIAAWVRMEANRTGSIVARMDHSGKHQGYALGLSNGALDFLMREDKSKKSALRVRTEVKVPQNAWAHVVVTYDGGGKAAGVMMFMDGRAAAVKTVEDNLNGSPRSDQPLYVGSRASGHSPLNGSVDELMIFDRVLSGRDVDSLARTKGLEAGYEVTPLEVLTLEIPLSLTGGSTCEAGLWLRMDGPTGHPFRLVFLPDEGEALYVAHGTATGQEWRQFKGRFTLPEAHRGQIRLSLQSMNRFGRCYVDDVEFSELK